MVYVAPLASRHCQILALQATGSFISTTVVLAHEQGKALLIELQGPDLDEEACEATWQELMHTVEQHGLADNRWRVFRSANTAHLGHRGDQEGQPRVVPSEKYMECA
jgi:hypothetical protein